MVADSAELLVVTSGLELSQLRSCVHCALCRGLSCSLFGLLSRFVYYICFVERFLNSVECSLHSVELLS